MAIDVFTVQSVGDWARARQLIEAYVKSLGIDLSFQNLQHELDSLELVYSAPEGVFLLAKEGDGLLGCVGLRRLTVPDSEMKRLYVVPEARARGVGRLLAIAAIEAADRLGYRRVLLDTLPSMPEARALYGRLGFSPIEPYRFNPVAGTVFMALDIPSRSQQPKETSVSRPHR